MEVARTRSLLEARTHGRVRFLLVFEQESPAIVDDGLEEAAAAACAPCPRAAWRGRERLKLEPTTASELLLPSPESPPLSPLPPPRAALCRTLHPNPLLLRPVAARARLRWRAVSAPRELAATRRADKRAIAGWCTGLARHLPVAEVRSREALFNAVAWHAIDTPRPGTLAGLCPARPTPGPCA